MNVNRKAAVGRKVQLMEPHGASTSKGPKRTALEFRKLSKNPFQTPKLARCVLSSFRISILTIKVVLSLHLTKIPLVARITIIGCVMVGYEVQSSYGHRLNPQSHDTGALTMRTFLETSANFTDAENSMKSYVDFVLTTGSEVLSKCRKLSYTFTSSLHTLRT